MCSALWGYLISMRVFVYIQYAQDPFFESSYAARVDVLYKYLQAFGILVMTLYLIYFLMIFYRAIQVIRNLKKTYRYSLGLTMFSLTFTLAIMS